MGDKSSIVASLWCCQRNKNGSTSSSQPSQSESILKSDICPILVLTYIASGIYVLYLYLHISHQVFMSYTYTPILALLGCCDNLPGCRAALCNVTMYKICIA